MAAADSITPMLYKRRLACAAAPFGGGHASAVFHWMCRQCKHGLSQILTNTIPWPSVDPTAAVLPSWPQLRLTTPLVIVVISEVVGTLGLNLPGHGLSSLPGLDLSSLPDRDLSSLPDRDLLFSLPRPVCSGSWPRVETRLLTQAGHCVCSRVRCHCRPAVDRAEPALAGVVVALFAESVPI